jgi:cysteine-rich repeat protein
MRTRGGWWAIVCAVGGFLTTSDAWATAPGFPGVITTTLTSADQDLPIPDNGSLVTVLTSELAGVVVDVDLTLDITHPNADQLDVYLVGPSGRTVTLATDDGQQNDDVFAGTTFDDQATGAPSAPNVRNFTYTNAVATGPIQPEGAMSALVGETAAGPWALVVVDDGSGSTGMLHGWSLTISTLSSLPPAAPTVDVDGTGGAIPDNDATGLASSVDVAGLGSRLLAVTATVSITHPNAAHLDLFLTSPAGTRIDLATDIGNGLVDLYQDVTFDDAADTPISDTALPPTGPALTRVVPEGALGAFAGENPNGTWTLTVVDDTGGTTGTLDGWTLHVTAVAACGDGVVAGGEACDDGNATDGDGCDHDCSVSACGNGIVGGTEACDDGNTVDGDGCSSSCQLAEAVCDDCTDDDGNGLVDAADPGCSEAAMTLGRSSAVPGKGILKLRGDVPLADGQAGPVSVVLADANGTILCTSLGDAQPKGKKLIASARVGGGTLAFSIAGGRVMLKGKHVDLSAFDDDTLSIGVGIGPHRFAAAAAFRAKGAKRVYP